MADPQFILRKSVRIRDRAAARAERETEQVEQQQQLKQEQEKQPQGQQQHKQWVQYRNALVTHAQKSNRAKTVHNARMKTSGKSLPGLRLAAATIARRRGGDTTSASPSDSSGSGSGPYSNSDPEGDEEGEDDDDDEDEEDVSSEDDEDEEMVQAVTRSAKRNQRASSSSSSSSSSSTSSYGTSTLGKRIHRRTSRSGGKTIPRTTAATTKTAFRDRRSNAARRQRPTRPPRTRRHRHNDDDYSDSNDASSSSSSSSINVDNFLPSLDKEGSSSEGSVTLVSDYEEQQHVPWTPESWARHLMAKCLYTFMKGRNHALTPLALVIYWMPRVPNPYPEDTMDLWTMPLKALGQEWETAKVLDTLRTDQVAHWLHLPVGVLIGFLTQAAPGELRQLNWYLHFRLDLMRTMQAMPSCFEWLNSDRDPQPGDPAYRILYRLRSLDEEFQRLLIWAIQSKVRIRREDNIDNGIYNITPRPYIERHYRAEFDFLVKTWNMFRARISPVIQYRASKAEFPGFEDKRAKNRWCVKVDTKNPPMEGMTAEEISAVIEADHAYLGAVSRKRQVYMKTTMIDDESVIAAHDPRCPLALLSPIRVHRLQSQPQTQFQLQQPPQRQPQVQAQAQAGDPNHPQTTAGSSAPAALMTHQAPPPPNAAAQTHVSVIPQEVRTKLGLDIQSADQWIQFAMKAMPQDESWCYYELSNIISDYHRLLPPDRLAVELPRLREHYAFLEGKIRREKQAGKMRIARKKAEARRNQETEHKMTLEEFQRPQEQQQQQQQQRQEQDVQAQEYGQKVAMEIQNIQLQQNLENLHHLQEMESQQQQLQEQQHLQEQQQIELQQQQIQQEQEHQQQMELQQLQQQQLQQQQLQQQQLQQQQPRRQRDHRLLSPAPSPSAD
ncbi:MAG: hypothetical protein J3R72DRAFT_502805 [Linnemannia gamsii]|nr:MAG: hypothetical protein J3R72DRAFT_502805 [Linnemannia gamsii]